MEAKLIREAATGPSPLEQEDEDRVEAATSDPKVKFAAVHFSGARNGNFRSGDCPPKRAASAIWNTGDSARQ